MKVNVGNYVRTKDGSIGKITYISEYNTAITTDYNTNRNIAKCVGISNIIKSSPNIIDLITKGDLIKYHFNGEDYISEVFEYKNDLWVQNEDNLFDISEINIKSIVTKEQFEAMEYKIN